jgi:spore coat protein U domain-containing protein, fimbrial subunit CupE1/2/3/6
MRDRFFLAALCLAATTIPARAQIACSVATAGVSFGRYSAMARSPTDASGSIEVVCTASTDATLAYSIALVGKGGTVTARAMQSAAARLSYQLYTDPAHTVIWGNGAAGGRVVTYAAPLAHGRTSTQRFTVFGRIQPGQNVPPGTYRDSVVVVLTY